MSSKDQNLPENQLWQPEVWVDTILRRNINSLRLPIENNYFEGPEAYYFPVKR